MLQKILLNSKFGTPISDFESSSQKIYMNDFVQLTYSDTLLDVFSDKIVSYYRNIDGTPNLVCQFHLSEVILSMKYYSKDFL